jgi:hypothetical protein
MVPCPHCKYLTPYTRPSCEVCGGKGRVRYRTWWLWGKDPNILEELAACPVKDRAFKIAEFLGIKAVRY